MIEYFQLTNDLVDFFRKLFQTEDFMARWSCGVWTGFHGWTYIIADLMISAAYFTIPGFMFYFLRNKKSVPFPKVLSLFILFILFCGSTHLMDAIIFWVPAYRLNGLLLVCTGIVSWLTVGAIIKTIPIAFKMKTTDELTLIINRRTAELEHQKDNLDDFAQIISHNLRSPIASFTSLIELYELKDSPVEKAQIVNKFKQVISKMNNSIDNMSEVVNWELGEVKSESLDISSVFNIVKASFNNKIETEKITIHTNYNGIRKFHYPRIYLESIFLNLMSNAIKYRSKDKDSVINLTLDKHKDGLIITFKDNGIGIDLDRYGHKVFQINETFHNNTDSRGIGLYLVKRHVEKLDGNIRIESEVGQGTTFHLLLKNQK